MGRDCEETPGKGKVDMFSRRALLGAMALAALVTPMTGAWAAEPPACTKGELTEEGLHRQPWFVQDTFFDMKEELAQAREKGKFFAVIIEQKGCPYCKMMHEKYFGEMPEICDLMRKNFRVLQVNLKGSQEVTDFDGTPLPENEWAKRYMEKYWTPYILFFRPDADTLKVKEPKERLIEAMVGLPNPFNFKAYLLYVTERAYEKQDFRSYLRDLWARQAKK